MSPEHEALVESLVGKPYREGADGPDAFDCYGLVRFAMGATGLIALPEINRPQGERPCGEAIGRALAGHPELGAWRKVGEPEDWDVAVMANVQERRRHIGLCVRLKATLWVIHAQDAPVNRVILDDLPSLQIKGFNHVEFYRRKQKGRPEDRPSPP